ncbi:MAG: hypothetical protein ACJAWW_001798 [Sulfurimonas sp.]|jgi:hypothetical protein
MDVSSSSQSDSMATQIDSSSVQMEVMKKATQEQEVLKVLENANEQSREVTAQKTGMGNNINITG